MSHMKKALIVTAYSGFLPQFEMNNVKLLQERGFEVHYISNFQIPFYDYEPDCLEKAGIICHQMDMSKQPLAVRTNRKAYRQLKELVKTENFDLFHVHNPVAGVLGRLAARHSRPKKDGRVYTPFVIYTSHGFHFYRGCPLKNRLLYETAEKFMARFTDMIITINQEDFENAGKMKLRKGGSAERIFGVGVDARLFSESREERAAVRKELDLPEDAFHLVTAAELTANKNQQVVIRALGMLKNPDIYYTLCGKGDDEEKLRELARSLGLEKQVRIIGYRRDMHRVLQGTDCFVFPSIREGLGLAAVEALMCGVPVIAEDNRGSREYLQDGKNGIACHGKSAEEYRDAVEKLFCDRKLCLELGGNARESVLHFSKENAERLMRQIYDKAVSRMEER